jgi:serine/threonine protein phosphatase 1
MEQENIIAFKANTTGRDFIVGDLHGCFDQLLKLTEIVRFDPKKGDRLFCTGDLVDRGPQSIDTLSIVKHSWCHSVIGNHEQFLQQIADADPATSMYGKMNHQRNGGQWLLDAAEAAGITPEELAAVLVDQYVSLMPLIIVVGTGKQRFNIVHAELYRQGGLMTDWDIDNWAFTPEEVYGMTWGRTIWKSCAGFRSISDNPDYRPMQHDLSRTYVGHTPTLVVCMHENQVYIDTGAYAAHRRAERGLTIVDHHAQKYYTYHPMTGTHSEYTVPPF